MTDRIASITVILDRDIRDDDAQPIVDAIAQIKGVLEVRPDAVTITDRRIAENAFRAAGVRIPRARAGGEAMSYPRDVDEIPAAELERELARRAELRREGLCDYCHREPSEPTCKFPERHVAGAAPESEPEGKK